MHQHATSFPHNRIRRRPDSGGDSVEQTRKYSPAGSKLLACVPQITPGTEKTEVIVMAGRKVLSEICFYSRKYSNLTSRKLKISQSVAG